MTKTLLLASITATHNNMNESKTEVQSRPTIQHLPTHPHTLKSLPTPLMNLHLHDKIIIILLNSSFICVCATERSFNCFIVFGWLLLYWLWPQGKCLNTKSLTVCCCGKYKCNTNTNKIIKSHSHTLPFLSQFSSILFTYTFIFL